MSTVIDLADQAAKQGLRQLAGLLRRAETTEAAEVLDGFDARVPSDPRLAAPASGEPIAILPQLVRRGLDPTLVRELLAGLREQPLEAGLIAWDTLNQALLPERDPLVDELRQLARPLKAILPDPGRGGLELGTHPATEVLPRWSGASAIAQVSEVQLMAWALAIRCCDAHRAKTVFAATRGCCTTRICRRWRRCTGIFWCGCSAIAAR